jgi:hypothetical protein
MRSSAEPLYQAAQQVFDELELRLAAIQRETGWRVNHGSGVPRQRHYYVAFASPVSLRLSAHWLRSEGIGELVFVLYKGRYLTPDEEAEGKRLFREPEEWRTKTIPLILTEAGWFWRSNDQTLTASDVAEAVTQAFLYARAKNADVDPLDFD